MVSSRRFDPAGRLSRDDTRARCRRSVAKARLAPGRTRDRYGDPVIPDLTAGTRNTNGDAVGNGWRRGFWRLPEASGHEDSRLYRPDPKCRSAPVDEDSRSCVIWRSSGKVDLAASQRKEVCPQCGDGLRRQVSRIWNIFYTPDERKRVVGRLAKANWYFRSVSLSPRVLQAVPQPLAGKPDALCRL